MLRNGTILPLAGCGYCHGSGTIKVIKHGLFGQPKLVSVPCAHRAGDPFSKGGRS